MQLRKWGHDRNSMSRSRLIIRNHSRLLALRGSPAIRKTLVSRQANSPVTHVDHVAKTLIVTEPHTAGADPPLRRVAPGPASQGLVCFASDMSLRAMAW